MLRRKPNHVQVFAPEQQVTTDGEALPASEARKGDCIWCQITPATAKATFERWGVETQEPYDLLCDLEDEKHFPIGASLWWPELRAWFRVAANPMPWAMGTSLDCAQVLLSRNRLKTGAPR